MRAEDLLGALYEAVEAIDSILTQEERELLAVKRGSESHISFIDQLKAHYGGRLPLYPPFLIKVRAANIMETHRLNLEKLRMEDEFIEAAKKIDTYFKESQQITEGNSKTGVLASAKGITVTDSFSQSKSRTGAVENYKEYDMIKDGDEADERTMKSILERPKVNELTQDYQFVTGEREDELPRLVISEVAPKEAKDINLKETSEEVVPLDTMDLNTSRSVGVSQANSASSTGRLANKNKKTNQITKTFNKADAYKRGQRYHYIDMRQLILQSFDCLFSDKRYLKCL